MHQISFTGPINLTADCFQDCAREGASCDATGEFYMLSEGLEISDKDSIFQVFVINPYAKQVLLVNELQYVWHTRKLIQHLLAAMIISYFL